MTLTSSQTVRHWRVGFNPPSQPAAAWRILGLQVYQVTNVPHLNGLDFAWFLDARIMSLRFLRTGCYLRVLLYSRLLRVMKDSLLMGQSAQISPKKLFSVEPCCHGSIIHTSLCQQFSIIFYQRKYDTCSRWALWIIQSRQDSVNGKVSYCWTF